MCLLALIAAVLLPESPKFYYAKREFKKARNVIKLISGLNKSGQSYEQIDSIIFDSEAYLYQKDVPEDLDKDDSTNEGTNINESRAAEEEVVDIIQECIDIKPLVQDGEDDVIQLQGTYEEVWSIWQIKWNFLVILALLSISSFSFYLI
jgi:hypothetical protein